MDKSREKLKILSVIGPTGVGKTALVFDLIRALSSKYEFEIISCDSMQIYKYMDIGSAKPSKEELREFKHHMIDIIDPIERKIDGNNKPFSVYEYSVMAREAINEIISKGKIPLITGGTGLYLDSIIYDIDFASSPNDFDFRNELYDIALNDGPEALYEILKEKNPELANRIHPNNIKKMVRAIESLELGDVIKEYDRDSMPQSEYDPIIIGLSRDREELYDRINSRVDNMIEMGLLNEVKFLYDSGLRSDDYSMKGIGYKEFLDYLDGKTDYDTAVNQIKTGSRHYAKRQLTWFKKYDDIKWFDLTHNNDILPEMEEWLKKKL